MSAPSICKLTIERFRGIKELSWRPGRGVNVILGGGDVGKTTILDAIGLLLSPVGWANLSDADYNARNIEQGFAMEAVMCLPAESGINNQVKPCWPWEWNGKEAVVPNMLATDGAVSEPVYRVRVRGTEDLELLYEVVQPDGTTDAFSVALRRAIGLVWLSGDDRNDRDLRLVQGSALDRLLSDRSLRSRLASDLAKDGVKDQLAENAKKALVDLDAAFKQVGLPDGLDLAVTGGQGFSVAALIGLTASRQGVQLPLASWGSGTRRMSALAIAERNQGEAPITLVDEIERGLEPYRQRSLVEKLRDAGSQVFVTTHSPFVISAAAEATLWYMDHEGKIGPIEGKKAEKHRKDDPEAFLARLTVVAEGATECGFVTILLEKALDSALERFGLHVSDGGGHETTLDLLEALADGGLLFCGFADDEGKHPERWGTVREKLGELLFRWTSGCLEENVIAAVPEENLESVLVDPDETKTGSRLRSLADRLGIQDKRFEAVKAAAGDSLRELILSAALGAVPAGKDSERKQFQAHAQDWFKSRAGGHELAEKMFKLRAWPKLKPQLMPFCNAVRRIVNLGEIEDLDP
jgi:putative ATP-dependent endonuclease of the OLD family